MKKFSEACNRLRRLTHKLANRHYLICVDFQCDPNSPGKVTDILLASLPDDISTYIKSQQFTFIHNLGSTSNIDHFLTNVRLSGSALVESKHTMSDHLGLSFKFLFKPVSLTPESGKFYTKSEWSKINREMYAATSDSNLNKIKVPYHLLLHGSKNQIALDVYCWENIHTMEVGETAAVPKCKSRKGTRKLGWDTCPKPKIARWRAKFWYGIWLDSNKPRSMTLFNLFRRTKKKYSMLVNRTKMENADEVSKEAINDPNHMWKCIKKSDRKVDRPQT